MLVLSVGLLEVDLLQLFDDLINLLSGGLSVLAILVLDLLCFLHLLLFLLVKRGLPVLSVGASSAGGSSRSWPACIY